MIKYTTRQLQAISTKNKIINSALKGFSDVGFEKFTVRDICQVAEISIGNFYHYFSSKEDLLDKIYDNFDILLEIKHSHEKFATYQEGFYFLIGEQVGGIEGEGVSLTTQLFKNQMTLQDKYILNKNRYFYKALLALSIQGISNGGITFTKKPEEVVELLLRVTRGGIYNWCLHEGNFPLKETILKDISLLITHGF